ncbi:unnamed protein product, partial [marine sediment metagenome]
MEKLEESRDSNSQKLQELERVYDLSNFEGKRLKKLRR